MMDGGWTLDTLKAHFESILAERAVQYQQRFEASEKRLESMNEFRQALNDAQGKYITRTEAMAVINRNAEDIKAVEGRLNISQGRGSGLKDGWGWVIGIIGLGLVALGLYLHK